MAKIRVHDLAKQMGVTSKDLIFMLQSIGVDVVSHNSTIDDDIISAILEGKEMATPNKVIIRDTKEVKPKVPRPDLKKKEDEPVPVVAPPPRPAEGTRLGARPMVPKTPGAPGVAGGAPPPPAASPVPAAPGAMAAAATSAASAPAAAAAPAAQSPASGGEAATRQHVPAAAPPPPAPPSSVRAGAHPAVRPPGTPLGRVEGDPVIVRRAPLPPARPPMGRSASSYGTARPTGSSYTPGARPGIPGSRPSGPPGSRPSGPGGPGGPGGRPSGPGGPGSRPSGGAMGRPMRPGTAPAPPPAAEERRITHGKKKEFSAEEEKKAAASKKGAGKKPKVVAAEEVNPDDFLGKFEEDTYEDIEEIQMEVEKGPPISARRKQDSKNLVKPQDRVSTRGKLLEFKKPQPKGTVYIAEAITVRELADKLGVLAKDLMKALFDRGIVSNINQTLEPGLAVELATSFNADAKAVTYEEAIAREGEQQRDTAAAATAAATAAEDEENVATENDGAKKPEIDGRSVRPPVVTVMGHVDHGKTSLLDAIRKTNVAAGEAGGITQHIGAYHVDVGERRVVFLDTPGHEAFTMMRARGARATDIVVLVVAADDGVMPQTIEAINHARAAQVPIIVAINKIDKANANVDRVKKELSEHDLIPEDWGGQTVTVQLSALKRTGIDQLLEMILLVTDLSDLRSNPASMARGVVLEAQKDPGRGVVATVLVQDGTLHIGDVFIAGQTIGRVRAMIDDRGNRVKETGPASAVEVTGLSELPNAGDVLTVVEDESKARQVAGFRAAKQRESSMAASSKMSLDQLFTKISAGEAKELRVVVKADVQGSVEVLADTLGKLSTGEVKVRVLHAGVGAITVNDVLLASASEAIVIGFNVRPERSASDLAEKEEVDIRMHTVIYNITDELRKAMTGLLEPTFKEVVQGRAEIRNTFNVPKIGTVAGCMVLDGVIPRSAQVRLLRDNRVVYTGKLGSLRRFKDDVAEVRSGFECGLGIERFQDYKIGDIVEAYIMEKEAAKLA